MIDLVPLYALDALEGAEMREFESHLETCQECVAELSLHRSVTAALIADQPAPGPVWGRIAAAVADPEAPQMVSQLSERRAVRDRPLRLIASVAAVLALLLGGLAVFQAVEINEMTGPEAVLAAAEAAAGEPGAIIANLDSPTGPVARVILTPGGEGFLVPANLETLPPDRTYQLWVITPDGVAISAGVLGNERGWLCAHP
jgi:anti-sigma-K factor RskA